MTVMIQRKRKNQEEMKTMDDFKNMKTIVVKKGSKTKKEKKKPTIITWNGAKLMRGQSIKIPVNDILALIKQLDVVKINIIGNPSTGKSTLATTLAHLLHKQAKIKFAVKILAREDMSKLKDILNNLSSGVNWILVFDDISFLSANLSKKEVENIQKEFTEIRHLHDGKDIKVICIFNFHYTMAVTKYLRQSDFSFYTTVGRSDFDNVVKTFGKTATRFLKLFTRIQGMAFSPSERFIFKLGKEKKITYITRKPFAPILYFNAYRSGIYVFPTRKWIDEKCVICDNAQKNTNTISEKDLETFSEKLKKSYGIQMIKQGLKVMAFINGINTYSKRTQQLMKQVESWCRENKVDLEQLLEFFNIEAKTTRLDVAKDELFDPKVEAQENGSEGKDEGTQ